MVNVAVAGGTGHLGRTIAEFLNQNADNEVLVLSRKPSPGLGLNVKAVDYADVDQLTRVFEEHKIEVVISALAMWHPGAGAAQINLIKAADRSVDTKRFVVSHWGPHFPKEYLEGFPDIQDELNAIEEASRSNLEWTIFRCGYLLDYFGMPHVKTHMPNIPFVVDVANKEAAIPGTGEQPVTFVYSFDLAKFVDAALRLPKWEHDTYVIGDQLTFNQFVRLAEGARGSAFTIRYDDVDKLKRFEITELPGHVDSYASFPKEELQRMLSTFALGCANGLFETPYEKSLNKVFPEITPITAEEFLRDSWEGR